MKESSDVDSFSPVAVSASLSSLGRDVNREPKEDNVEESNDIIRYPFQSAKSATSSEPILYAGEIYARISPTKLFTKEWRRMIWVQQGPYTLHFFKTRQDYVQWKQHHGGVTSAAEQELLENSDEGADTSGGSPARKTINFIKELARSGVQGFTLGNIVPKSYPDLYLTDPLYQFKLDCWTFFGPVTVAALGSTSKEEAKAMHQRVHDMYIAAYDHTYPARQNTTLDTLEYEDA